MDIQYDHAEGYGLDSRLVQTYFVMGIFLDISIRKNWQIKHQIVFVEVPVLRNRLCFTCNVTLKNLSK